ncbi:MAG: glycosyltransferase family 2 protein [Verrucomicrobia bacterium]|nr:glycosyltransferase family 2 protein [Verrucomicrobiota bacterium]
MIAVIILNWNNAPDTLECLASVYQSDDENFKVFVADNGSTDGSLPLIQSQYPQAAYIENKKNLGFAEGNNRAIEIALNQDAAYLFLLNNDAVVAKDTLSTFRQTAETHLHAAAFGAKTYFYDAPSTIWYGGADWDSRGVQWLFRDWNVEESQAPKRSIEETDFLCGCALFLRSSQIRKIGLMDPRFFLNWEEVDWCSRMRKMGFSCLFVPQVKVWHKISRSFQGGREGAMWSYYFHRNRLLWMEKNLSWRQNISLARTFLIPLIFRLIRESFGPYKTKARASLRGICDYFLRNFGPGPF